MNRHPIDLALAGVAGAALSALLLLPAGPGRPTVDVRRAERDAVTALRRTTPGCEAQGLGAEAFAEVNSDEPDNYRIIAQCVTITTKAP